MTNWWENGSNSGGVSSTWWGGGSGGAGGAGGTCRDACGAAENKCTFGCTDPTAPNYDPLAQCDDGSCDIITYDDCDVDVDDPCPCPHEAGCAMHVWENCTSGLQISMGSYQFDLPICGGCGPGGTSYGYSVGCSSSQWFYDHVQSSVGAFSVGDVMNIDLSTTQLLTGCTTGPPYMDQNCAEQALFLAMDSCWIYKGTDPSWGNGAVFACLLGTGPYCALHTQYNIILPYDVSSYPLHTAYLPTVTIHPDCGSC